MDDAMRHRRWSFHTLHFAIPSNKVDGVNFAFYRRLSSRHHSGCSMRQADDGRHRVRQKRNCFLIALDKRKAK